MSSLIKICFALLMFGILVASCDEELKRNKIDADSLAKNVTPDQTGWNVEVHFVDTSFTKAILNAGRTRVFQQRLETLLDGGMKVQFFSRKNNSRVSLLTADSAVIDDRTRNMVAMGDVKVVGDSSGTILTTTTLHWDNKTQKIYTTEFVQIVSINETIQGYGFESDQSLSNYKIYKVSGIQR